VRCTSDETCVGSPTRQKRFCRGTVLTTLLRMFKINSAAITPDEAPRVAFVWSRRELAGDSQLSGIRKADTYRFS
jgi:hypothetical protein